VMLNPKDAIHFTFNKFFFDLIEDIQHANADLAKITKEHYKVKNMNSVKNLESFKKSLDAIGAGAKEAFVKVSPENITTHTDLKDLVIVKGITLDRLVSTLDADYHQTIACYLYNFALMSALFDYATTEEDESNVNELFTQVMQILKSIQTKRDYSTELDAIYDEDIRILLKNIDATSPVSDGSSGGPDEATGADDPMSDLEGTKIGAMAKEISQELDLNELKIEKPEDVMKLMSGNALGNIIGKVGDKIQKKISTGEMKQEDLVNEALSMLGMLNKGGNGLFNNPMMQEMMKNKNIKVDPSKLRVASTKDRLRRKLDERKERSEGERKERSEGERKAKS
jgi:hypothetical protein